MSLLHYFTSHSAWEAWGGISGATTRRSTLMDATDSPDTHTPFAAAPTLRNKLIHLQSTLARQMKRPSSFSNHCAQHFAHTAPNKHSSTRWNKRPTSRCWAGYVDNSIQKSTLLSQTASTGAHLQQPNNEAYEADDRWPQVTQRTSRPHAPMSALPNEHARAITDAHQLHCVICKKSGAV